MLFSSSDRKQLGRFLPPDYRKIVLTRLAKRGVIVHENTITNVWQGRSSNATVADEILIVINEAISKSKKFTKAKEKIAA